MLPAVSERTVLRTLAAASTSYRHICGVVALSLPVSSVSHTPICNFTNHTPPQPWKTLCGFPPTTDNVTLLVPNGRWRPDTVITDVDGNEIFVIVEQTNEMRSYEIVLGDLDGRRLVCVKRHLMKAFWRDGFYFCTYRANYPGQKALTDRDIDNKKIYPFAYLEIHPMKGRFIYRHFDRKEKLKPPRMISTNPWFGFMVVCCTPLMRFGRFTTKFHKPNTPYTVIEVDQWKNQVQVGPGNDLLAALCMAYVFDRVQGQPLITVVGRDEDEELEADDEASLESQEDDNNKNKGELELENMPEEQLRLTNHSANNSGPRHRGYRDEPHDQGVDGKVARRNEVDDGSESHNAEIV